MGPCRPLISQTSTSQSPILSPLLLPYPLLQFSPTPSSSSLLSYSATFLNFYLFLLRYTPFLHLFFAIRGSSFRRRGFLFRLGLPSSGNQSPIRRSTCFSSARCVQPHGPFHRAQSTDHPLPLIGLPFRDYNPHLRFSQSVCCDCFILRRSPKSRRTINYQV